MRLPSRFLLFLFSIPLLVVVGIGYYYFFARFSNLSRYYLSPIESSSTRWLVLPTRKNEVEKPAQSSPQEIEGKLIEYTETQIRLDINGEVRSFDLLPNVRIVKIIYPTPIRGVAGFPPHMMLVPKDHIRPGETLYLTLSTKKETVETIFLR